MRHPPTVLGTVALLFLLAGALLVSPLPSPTAAQASAPRDESGALENFYARMLEEHEGVFIEEELAGVLDRHEVAEDLRAQLAEHEYRNNVLVVGDPAHKVRLDVLAHAVANHLQAPVLVLSPNSNHVGMSRGRLGEIPEDAVQYAYYTGSRPADPRDQLARVLRAAQYRHLEKRTAVAEVEYEVITEGRYRADPRNDATPGLPTQRWLAVSWTSTAAVATGVLTAWAAVALTAGFLRRRRARVGKADS
ncbi:hypothetical protein NE857_19350 [Nocardiopsis exhalans]|uniref:Uncharacterized protein n=1 Tax=Nocardiopsis exhalans TaxID=163604 RepID=A0ABY5D0R9_9ACTN|nr:hypothetical protein [Nocardiopsis exhalans]USY17497.1 hypothetical protein NE857_19350 [Nocardiopsis exhalans]